MKKKLVLRIAGIGIFHAVLYGYVVPFVLYSKFGSNGVLFAGVVALSVSVAVVGTLFFDRKIKGDNK